MFENESENTIQQCLSSLDEKRNLKKNFFNTVHVQQQQQCPHSQNPQQHRHHHHLHHHYYHHYHNYYNNEQQEKQHEKQHQQQQEYQQQYYSYNNNNSSRQQKDNQRKVKIWLSTGSINNVFLWLKDVKDKMKHRMRTRHRGPKYPLPSSSSTAAAAAAAADLSDSTYYASYDADIDDYNNSAYPGRCYIDPWDLENYEYVRRQLNPSPDRTSTTPPSPESGEQEMSSNFFYLPNNIDECPACCAGMDEQTFYNTKYETIIDDETTPYCSYTTEFESPGSGGSGGGRSSNSGSPTERNRSSTSSVSSLMLHTPGFGAAASNRRRLVLPKPAPRLEFPAPPPYDYCLPGPAAASSTCVSCPACAYGPENNYYSLSSDCYECLSNPNGNTTESIYIPLSSIYGGIGGGSYIGVGNGSSGGRSSLCSYNTYTSRFGLSKKGLLQIDYSCNWNDLDRLIGTKGL